MELFGWNYNVSNKHYLQFTRQKYVGFSKITFCSKKLGSRRFDSQLLASDCSLGQSHSGGKR